MVAGGTLAARAAFERRTAPTLALAGQADAIAEACAAMAEAFHARGAQLITFGTGVGASDAAHVAVEYMHPVIVGKRALPALAVETHALDLFGRPGDIALGFVYDEEDTAGEVFARLRARGLLTVALVAARHSVDVVGADHVLVAGTADSCIAKELQVTTYHVLWELTHVYLERFSLAAPGGPR